MKLWNIKRKKILIKYVLIRESNQKERLFVYGIKKEQLKEKYYKFDK